MNRLRNMLITNMLTKGSALEQTQKITPELNGAFK
jgi:hypothetical protein